MKKTVFYFFILFLGACKVSKNTYPFAIKHGGKWVLYENNHMISISLDPTTSSFRGDLACSKIGGNYFLDEKKVKFFNIISIKKKECQLDEKLTKEDESFIDLLKNADSHQLNALEFKLYRGNLILIKLKREN